MKNILEVKNLSYTYQGENAEALHDLSFSVPAGSYVAIVGHNGSGKSTLAKIIAGLCSYKKGKVTLFGEELNKNNLPALRKRMGLVFQNPDNQFVGSSVRDDIAFGLENRQVPSEKMDGIILEYATKVSMEKYLDHAPENLSGGQKQRVSIARALVTSPKLILADEPTGALDSKTSAEVMQILREVNATGITMVIVTHERGIANLTRKIVHLKDGIIESIEENDPDKMDFTKEIK